jgi:hypothetical protein
LNVNYASAATSFADTPQISGGRSIVHTAVLFGMLGVTCFGLLFTPAFYTLIRRLGRKERAVMNGVVTAPELSGIAGLRGSAGRPLSASSGTVTEHSSNLG